MPAPLDPDKRANIVAAIEAGGTRNAIAREHGVSGHIVTKIAQEDNLDTSAWDRASVKRATEAKAADLAAERTRLAGLLMEDTFRLRERMWSSQQVVMVVGVKGGGARTELVDIETSAGDFRNYLTAIGIAVDKIGVLTRDDTQGLGAVDGWLRSLGVGATQG
jgi:transposase-like protein